MIWIIGEYAERIDNADELLESFLESFPEEPAQVQLQLLTATVKLFLKKPTEGPQQMIQVLMHVLFIIVVICFLVFHSKCQMDIFGTISVVFIFPEFPHTLACDL